jgi:hypothetical protein
MSSIPIILQGTLNADGTLQLDEKPGLPAGRVQVTIQSVESPEPIKEDWWRCLQRLRAGLERTGHRFRTSEEIEAEIQELRDWGEERYEQAQGTKP